MAHINCIAFLMALRARRLRSRVIRAMVLPPKAEVRAPPCSSRLFDDRCPPSCSRFELSAMDFPLVHPLILSKFPPLLPSFLSFFEGWGKGRSYVAQTISNLLCRQGWPWISDSPSATSQVLELQAILPGIPGLWVLGTAHKLSACSERFPNPFRSPFPFSCF